MNGSEDGLFGFKRTAMNEEAPSDSGVPRGRHHPYCPHQDQDLAPDQYCWLCYEAWTDEEGVDSFFAWYNLELHRRTRRDYMETVANDIAKIMDSWNADVSRLNGHKGGRPKKFSEKEVRARIRTLLSEGRMAKTVDSLIAEEFGVSNSTAKRVRILEQQNSKP